MSTSKREKTKQQLAFKRCVRCILSYGLCFTSLDKGTQPFVVCDG